jgi:hypothetical protein
MSDVFHRYLSSEETDQVLVSPEINMFAASSLVNKEWVSEVTFDDIVRAIEICGIDPIFHPEDSTAIFGEDHPLGWKKKIISWGADERTYESILSTPLGALRRISKEIRGCSSMDIESPVKQESDYEKLIAWLQAARREAGYVTNRYKEYRSIVRDRGLLRLEVPLPFEGLWWVPRQDPIYHSLDWPKTFFRFKNEALHTTLELIRAAVLGGADVIFFGSVGTELYSQRLIEEQILEDALTVSEYVRKLGVYSIFHCCGYAKVWIDSGYLNDVNPTIFESLSAPPVGEISDARAYRKKIQRSICTRGSIDLGTLHDGTLSAIEEHVIRTIDDMKGYKHMVAGTCAITAGTPLQNIRQLVRTTKGLGKHFM